MKRNLTDIERVRSPAGDSIQPIHPAEESMKFEDEFCSMELAKRLKELGVKQEGLFYWDWKNKKLFRNNEGFDIKESPYACIAFTVAELGEILPNYICSGRLEPYAPDDNEHYYCFDNTDVRRYETIWGATEADSRAKMLCWLVENKKVKP